MALPPFVASDLGDEARMRQRGQPGASHAAAAPKPVSALKSVRAVFVRPSHVQLPDLPRHGNRTARDPEGLRPRAKRVLSERRGVALVVDQPALEEREEAMALDEVVFRGRNEPRKVGFVGWRRAAAT
jgi:hypothetical protein